MNLLNTKLPIMNLRGRRFMYQFSVGLALLLALVGHVGGLYRLGGLDRLEAVIYDYKLQADMPRTVDERVVIVDIDDRSLREIGRWPWPRETMAKLTANLFQQYGVAAVGYDITFSEPDQSSGLPVLERLAVGDLKGEGDFAAILARLRPRLDYDARLAEALATGPAILGYYFSLTGPGDSAGQLPPASIDCAEVHRYGISPLTATGFNANLPILQDKAADAAFFNMQADFDGVARRMPMLIEYQGRCYGSLALIATRHAMASGALKIRPSHGYTPAALALDDLIVPLDRQAMALVPYRPPGAFRYISAADVFKGTAPAADLEGRAVLIGSTAPGIMDLRVTPTSKQFPGVEIHANLISGILDGAIRWEPVGARMIELIAVLALGLTLAALLPFVAPLRATLIMVAALALLAATDLYAWSHWHMNLPIATSLATVLGLFVLNMSYGFFVEVRSKAQITRLFGQYVPPELVDEMAKDPARYSLRGESRVMTVLFSDIVGFTTISEGLEASQLAEMLNLFLSHMTRLIQHNRGTIDKYIGDAIMAFWGAPMSDDRHARDAVLTGLAMQVALTELNTELAARGWPAVRIGVGVNTGRMSVGNMGSQFRMAYTVMADAVNLASRLEALTRQYGVGVLVGEATRESCPDIAFMQVDKVRVKGKAQPVTIYTPLGVTAEVAPARLETARQFEAALEDYNAQRWVEAEAKLQALNQATPGKLYDVYLERIAQFRNTPPPADWDGVFTYVTK